MKTSRNLRFVLLTVAVFGGTLCSRADQIIGDNLVIQGSMSVGIDAVSGWGYGADTLVFRENNLRIYFDDTSADNGSYPHNDWRISVNDSETNSASYFAIQDATANKTPFRIVAGAPDNALYINSDSVGIGTTDPKLDFHISSGDTPAIRLEQTNVKWSPRTWDIGANEANFYVRDTSGGGLLSFRIRPGAPTSSLDVNGNGNVGVGTASPKAKLHVEANRNNGEGMIVGLQASNAVNLATMHVDGSGYYTEKLGIGTNSAAKSNTLYVDGTAFISQTLEIGSSRTRKENIREVTLEEAQAALKDLQPVQFNYKGDSEQQLGFIAEDVPDSVATQSRKSLVPMDFVAVLTKVVQDHERRETELRSTVNAQQALLEEMAARLATMEERLQHSGINTVAQGR